MAAEPVGQAQGFFEVDLAGLGEADGAVEGFARDIKMDGVALAGDDGEAHAVVGDAVTELDVVEIKGADIHCEAHTVFKGRHAQDAAGSGNDSGEHGMGAYRGKTRF